MRQALPLLTFGLAVLLAMSWSENNTLQSDINQMRRAGGKPLLDRVVPGSVALFRAKDATIGCALMTEAGAREVAKKAKFAELLAASERVNASPVSAAPAPNQRQLPRQ